ncbi:hypothetical protein [Cellulomonas sp. KRMCY2]|uniref:hypothetical protein n=1 Tax=Cellulomonas sp. KRMCY2 TaxID=1304865 RepID=UPI00350E8FA9
MSDLAWRARERARVYGRTRVGCGVVTDLDELFSGCNIEHRFRSHDIHAEVSALSRVVSEGAQGQVIAILVVAERDNFTPCGACTDWIFELCGGATLVGFQREPGAPIAWRSAAELMPFYPS